MPVEKIEAASPRKGRSGLKAPDAPRSAQPRCRPWARDRRACARCFPALAGERNVWSLLARRRLPNMPACAAPCRRVNSLSPSNTAIARSGSPKRAGGACRAKCFRAAPAPDGLCDGRRDASRPARRPAATARHIVRQHGDGAERAVGFGRRPRRQDRDRRGGNRRDADGLACGAPARRRRHACRCGALTRRDRGQDRRSFPDRGAFAAKGEADADVVFHASASAGGLALAIASAGMEARVVEMSWYGEGAVAARSAARSIQSACN